MKRLAISIVVGAIAVLFMGGGASGKGGPDPCENPTVEGGPNADFFGTDSTKYGLLPEVITDPREIHELTALFSWTAWASAAERPGHNYSYTNNWPYQPTMGNTPTTGTFLWTWVSVAWVLFGIGAVVVCFRVVRRLAARQISPHPEEVPHEDDGLLYAYCFSPEPLVLHQEGPRGVGSAPKPVFGLFVCVGREDALRNPHCGIVPMHPFSFPQWVPRWDGPKV